MDGARHHCPAKPTRRRHGVNDVTFALISLAATAALIGLFVTARGIRMAAKLATLKSDFVSSVTHELKTPLSAIRLVADTLVQGRYESQESIRDYAGILAQGTRNMTRLIENLLTYSRLSDVGHAYAFERTDLPSWSTMH